MRAQFLPALFSLSLLGTIAMPSNGDGQEKKDPTDLKSYDEKVTVRQKTKTIFLNPVENVPAYRREIKGKQVFVTRPPADNAESPKGSEITDKDGAVWVVTDVTKGSNYFLNYVKKKEPEKKP